MEPAVTLWRQVPLCQEQAGRGVWLASEDPDGGVDLVYKTGSDIEALFPSPEKDDVQWKVDHYDPESEFWIGLNEPSVGVTSWYRVAFNWNEKDD